MTTRTEKIIKAAVVKGQKTLSEYESKRVLAAYGVPISREILVSTQSQAKAAACILLRVPWAYASRSLSSGTLPPVADAVINTSGGGTIRIAVRAAPIYAAGSKAEQLPCFIHSWWSLVSLS